MATFALDLSQFAEKVEVNAVGAVKKIILEMFSRVMKRTPVDLGTARANWDIGVNAIPEGFDLSLAGGEGLGAVSREAFAKGLTSLAPFKVGDTAYIVNNVEYIGFLEEGVSGRGSTQAPQGMVKITVREFQSIVNEFVVEA